MDWKDEFYKLYTSDAIADYKKALELKRNNLPSRLYRYRSLTDDTLNYRRREIILGELYLSHPDELNDPFEGRSVLKSAMPSEYVSREAYVKHYASASNPQELEGIFQRDDWFEALATYAAKKTVSEDKIPQTKHAVMKAIMSGYEQLNANISSLTRSMIRIACFSTSATNLPMWNHYASNHAGLCLEYDTRTIRSAYPLNRLFPVYYVDRLPDITHWVAHRNHPRFTLFDIQAIHKLNDWRYENEWRLLYNPGSWYHDPQDIPADFWQKGKTASFVPPSRIILGQKVCVEHEKEIQSCAKAMHIPVVKAAFNEYGLSFH